MLSLLKPEAFSECFGMWVAECLSKGSEGRLIAIDGKTLRPLVENWKGLKPSVKRFALAVRNQLVHRKLVD